jgi:hypothetical protein
MLCVLKRMLDFKRKRRYNHPRIKNVKIYSFCRVNAIKRNKKNIKTIDKTA